MLRATIAAHFCHWDHLLTINWFVNTDVCLHYYVATKQILSWQWVARSRVSRQVIMVKEDKNPALPTLMRQLYYS